MARRSAEGLAGWLDGLAGHRCLWSGSRLLGSTLDLRRSSSAGGCVARAVRAGEGHIGALVGAGRTGTTGVMSWLSAWWQQIRGHTPPDPWENDHAILNARQDQHQRIDKAQRLLAADGMALRKERQ